MNRAARRTVTAIASVAAATVVLAPAAASRGVRVLALDRAAHRRRRAANGCTAEAPPMRMNVNEANKRLTSRWTSRR